jgi:hypothetical protein
MAVLLMGLHVVGLVGGWARVFGVYHRNKKSLQIISVETNVGNECVIQADQS